ncbi:hypothetical protein T492DRAFT_955488 [Pavlovales sp. CCMP2436]|nr:hypothetical protein T492DRAFT_955488 [Pavlovales sp. CCMP2436]
MASTRYCVHRFSLAADVAASLLRPHYPSGGEFATPPLLDQLATVMFQNLFPPIDVGKLNIKTCRRIVLVHHDKTLGRTHIRQFAITATPTGMSRVLKKLLRATPNAKLGAKLSQLEDISQLLDRDGYSSESGAETDQENEAVTLPQDYKGRGARKSQQCAIKLIELGPRLELELLKIEEGVCEGNVIYHKYVTKTPKEVAELKQRAEDKRESKAARKREQEANVQRKAEAKTAAQEAKETARDAKRARRNEPVQLTGEGEGEEDDDEEEEEGEEDEGEEEEEVTQRAKGGGKGGKGEEDSEADDEADSESEPSDVDWYREEVGEEPEAGLFRAGSGKSEGKKKPAAKREKCNPPYKSKKRSAGADKGADKGAAPASGRSAGGRCSSGSPAGGKRGRGGRG